MKFADYFDQIYIIHLDVLNDRKHSIINHINRYGLKNITIIDALNKNRINIEKLKEDEKVAYSGNNYCKTAIINELGHKCWCDGNGHNDVISMTGRMACAYSHYFAYKDMYENEYEKCLVLEDDFVLNEKLGEIWDGLYENIPEDWEVLYFSNTRKINYSLPDLFIDLNKSFAKTIKGVADSGCYAVKKSAIIPLYENFFPIRAASDSYIGVCIDRLFKIKNAYISKIDLSRNGSYAYMFGGKESVFSQANDNIEIKQKDINREELNAKMRSLVNKYNKIPIEPKYLIDGTNEVPEEKKSEEIKETKVELGELTEKEIEIILEYRKNSKLKIVEVKKNVISFCLYGSAATYILGMKENIRLAKKFYENWEVRIYYNSTVPEKYILEYKNDGANCILCENVGINKMNWEGMFWRWLPLDDESVHCWISRDADSRLSEREAKIVNEWIESGKTLHSIRDHKCHMHYIMGGMFGINNTEFNKKYKFKKVKDIIVETYKHYRERPYNVDQIFLNDNLWGMLKDDSIAHIANGGRRVFDRDISIGTVGDFIGKQYRLDESLVKEKVFMELIDVNKNTEFKIKSKYTDLFMTNENGRIKLRSNSYNDNQYWKYDDKNRLQSVLDNRYMDIDTKSREPDMILVDNTEKSWVIQQGGFIILNKQTKAIDFKGGIKDRRQTPWLFSLNYSEAQQWDFIVKDENEEKKIYEKRVLCLNDRFHHKNKKGLEMICKHRNYELIYGNENDIESSDTIYAPSYPYDSSKYPKKRFVFGPHFSVFPDARLEKVNNTQKNSVYIQPSPWAKDVWVNKNAEKHIPIEYFPFPVDTEKFKPNENNIHKRNVMIMFKYREQNELNILENAVKEKEGNNYRIFRYGSYKEEDYLEYLTTCKYGLWVGTHESQGFGLQEALSCNLPLLVWNAKNMNQQTNWRGAPSVEAKTIAYWDERCGEYFESEGEFKEKYDKFIEKLENYKPREFVIENLGVEKCSQRFDDLFFF